MNNDNNKARITEETVTSTTSAAAIELTAASKINSTVHSNDNATNLVVESQTELTTAAPTQISSTSTTPSPNLSSPNSNSVGSNRTYFNFPPSNSLDSNASTNDYSPRVADSTNVPAKTTPQKSVCFHSVTGQPGSDRKITNGKFSPFNYSIKHSIRSLNVPVCVHACISHYFQPVNSFFYMFKY